MPLKQMKETLLALREYALEQGVQASLSLHREDSHLVRLANSAVSLNTAEQVNTLRVEAFGERRSATASLVCDLHDFESLKKAVDRAKEMLAFASPLSFQPTFPMIAQEDSHTASYDQGLAHMSNEDILAYLDACVSGLEDSDVSLGGSFSVGETARCFLSTANTQAVSWRLSDAQVTLVLASAEKKWEINAEQSAERLSDLDPQAMHRRLAYLKEKYTRCPAVRLPLGPCKVVFGAAATAEYLSFLDYLGLSGPSMKRGNSIHQEKDLGQEVFSPLMTVVEGGDVRGAFALPTDDFGRKRQTKAWYDHGVLKGFVWNQTGADEFDQSPTGHDLAHESYALLPGDKAVNTLEELEKMPRDTDILYVPYLHYTGVVSRTEGLITGTSRFGALLLKKDGSIEVPFNVRFTERLTDIFGKKLAWLSGESTAYNLSNTYDSRNPMAVVVPKLMCCDGVKVEISNKTY